MVGGGSTEFNYVHAWEMDSDISHNSFSLIHYSYINININIIYHGFRLYNHPVPLPHPNFWSTPLITHADLQIKSFHFTVNSHLSHQFFCLFSHVDAFDKCDLDPELYVFNLRLWCINISFSCINMIWQPMLILV